MGTRGAFGFVIRGEQKIAYNHFDSYPSGKGVEVLQFARGISEDLETVREQAWGLQVVDDDTPATTEQILALRGTSNFHVHDYPVSGPPTGVLPTEDVSWYNLLRETQGDLEAQLEIGYIEDGHLFPLDSLFCEWAYIVDLDEAKFEVYRGFQKERPKNGLWAGRPTDKENNLNLAAHLKWCKEKARDPWQPLVPDYKAVELAASWSLDALPTDEDFLGYFELAGAREVIASHDKYPEDVANLWKDLQSDERTSSGTYASEWAAIEAEAFAKLNPSDVANG